MAKPTFAELYKAGKAEPNTAYQRRIANGVDRGLSVSQARGHARTKKGEQKVSLLSQLNILPKITRRDRYTKVVNHRWVEHSFPVGTDMSKVAEYLQGISDGQPVTFQVVATGVPNLSGPMQTNQETEYQSLVHRFNADELEDTDDIAAELDNIYAPLVGRYQLKREYVKIRVRMSFGKPV